jgi:hypothetical protein
VKRGRSEERGGIAKGLKPMAEIKHEVQTYEVDYICDECKEGRMRFTGVELTVHPPIYPHLCDKCKLRKDFRCIYPKIVYEKAGDY